MSLKLPREDPTNNILPNKQTHTTQRNANTTTRQLFMLEIVCPCHFDIIDLSIYRYIYTDFDINKCDIINQGICEDDILFGCLLVRCVILILAPEYNIFFLPHVKTTQKNKIMVIMIYSIGCSFLFFLSYMQASRLSNITFAHE